LEQTPEAAEHEHPFSEGSFGNSNCYNEPATPPMIKVNGLAAAA